MKQLFYQMPLKHFGRRIVAAGSAAIMLGTMLAMPVNVLAANDDATVIKNLAPGTIISSTNFTGPTELQSVATAKRIKYVSTDPSGTRVPVTGVIFTPKGNKSGDTVAWAHGTTGIADACAPSVNPDVFYPEATDAIKKYVQNGWTVTATDYAGLGTRGVHPYLVGNSEGRAVIDSVRAARNLNSSLSRKWSVAGHSEGGQAALFAGEIASSYGVGLNLAGVAALAPASNLDILASAIPGTPGNGYLVLALYGLAAVDPTVHPEQLLAPPALAQVNAGALNLCGDVPILTAFGSLSATDLLVGGQLPDSILAKVAISNPGQVKTSVPILIAQGDLDETIPLEITQILQQEECGIGTRSFLKVYSGQDHIGVVYASENTVGSYFQLRFLGLPTPSNC